jgi:hypothetical protein
VAGLDRSKKRSDSGTQRVSRFSEVLGAAQESSQTFGYPDVEPVTQPDKKLAKREDPSYTQTTFRIPKKLSRQIDRLLIDLADEGVEIDRSDLLEELASAFIRLSHDVGVVGAIEQFKSLGTQIDE